MTKASESSAGALETRGGSEVYRLDRVELLPRVCDENALKGRPDTSMVTKGAICKKC